MIDESGGFGEPQHINCKCAAGSASVAFEQLNAALWRILLDENFGRTDPRLPEYRREPVGILNV